MSDAGSITTTKRAGDRLAILLGDEIVTVKIVETSRRGVRLRITLPVHVRLVSRPEALRELLGEDWDS